MSAENWIDKIADAFAVSDGKGGTVRSYRAFNRNEFPDAIKDFPSAITYPVDMVAKIYADAKYELWNGRTDFHLWQGVSKAGIPYIMPFFARIITAAAANLTLGGSVAYFQLKGTVSEGPSIQGPVSLSFGDELVNLGLVVYWEVKVLSTITLATGE